MTRLETVSPQLVETLRSAPTVKQRAVGLIAGNFAIARAGIKQPLLDEALATIAHEGSLPSRQKADLEALAHQLDGEYLRLLDESEDGCAGETCLRIFAQARAVAAIVYAGNDDSFKAATESIYEATATTDDPVELLTLVEAELA